MVSVSKEKRVTATTPAAPKKLGIAHVPAFSGLAEHAGYTKFCDTRASPTVLGKIRKHKLPMLIASRSEIWLSSEEVARELNIGWKHAHWKMITADGNQSNLSMVGESMPVNAHGIISPMSISGAKSGSEQGILGHPWATYAQKCKRNLDDGRCEITILTIDQ
jgi:hypothetical protein